MKTCSRELTHTTNTCSACIIMLNYHAPLTTFSHWAFSTKPELDPGHADPETKALGPSHAGDRAVPLPSLLSVLCVAA